MPSWPALCGLTHFIVSKDPLLLSVTHSIKLLKENNIRVLYT